MPKLDILTGLLHGQNLEGRLERLMERADDAGQTLSLIIADLGGLKRINIEYGHDAGDLTLKAVGVLLPAAMPDDALCYRLGGDAFVVVLRGTTSTEAAELAHRLQDALATSNIEVQPGKNINLRAFVGVSAYPDDAKTPRALLRAADRRMQATKAAEATG